jgi:WD40 repeat protein
MLVLELGHSRLIGQLAFAPDGRALAAVCDSGVYLWRTFADGARAEHLPDLFNYSAARFSADGQWVFTGVRELWRVDLVSGANAVLPLWGGYNTQFDVAPTEPFVLVAQNLGTDEIRTRLALWRTDDLSPAGEVWERDLAGYNYYPPQFLAGGDRFLLIEYTRTGPGSTIGFRVVFCDTATGAPRAATSIAMSTSYEFLCSADGHQLAARGTHRIDLYPLDPADARPVRICNNSQRYFTGMAFHPSGKYLAATSNDHTVKLYESATGDVIRTFTWNLGRMRSIAFSPDGTLAAAGSDRGKVVVWDVDV